MASILVVDDNIALSEMISEALRGADHEVVTAADGLKARSAAKQHQFELMITDISMPNEEGFGLIRAMRRQDADLRILVISGNGADLLDDARILGANMALQKPFGAIEILDAVAKLLGQYQGKTGHSATGSREAS